MTSSDGGRPGGPSGPTVQTASGVVTAGVLIRARPSGSAVQTAPGAMMAGVPT
jgi:hypothetical protein